MANSRLFAPYHIIGTKNDLIINLTSGDQESTSTYLLLQTFANIQSHLMWCTSAWHGNCFAFDCLNLQKVVYKASPTQACHHPSIKSIYMVCCIRKAATLVIPFAFISSPRKYRSMKAGTSGLNNSYFPNESLHSQRCCNVLSIKTSFW